MGTPIKEGDKAPDFTLPANGDKSVSLKDYRGKKLVLFFYPRDNTPGCTIENIEFTAAKTKFKRAGAELLGMSKDSVKKHENFIAKQELKVLLASDEESDTIERYGSWVEKNMYGKKKMGIERSTFLIDEKGIVRRIWRKVKVKGHVDEVLAAVKEL